MTQAQHRSGRTVALLLAAGSGSRFLGGGHKLTADLAGKPVYQWALEAALAAEIGPVVIVTGAVELALAPEFQSMTSASAAVTAAVTVAHNPQWSTGMAGSLQIGIAAARRLGAEAVVVGLADQPLVTAAAWRLLAASPSPIAVATYNGKRGNPVRLHAELWDAIPKSGDEGARSLLRIYPELVEEVPCKGSSSDIDTLEDLSKLSNDMRRNK